MRSHLGAMMLVMGCAGTGATDPADTDETDTEADTDGVDARVWDDFTADERLAYMTDEVLPALRTVFAEAYPERWPDITCETCHGPDMVAQGYAMPGPLSPMLLSAFPWPESFPDEDSEALTVFMRDEVTVAMAALLGKPVIDYDDPRGPGFGCLGCHPVGQED